MTLMDEEDTKRWLVERHARLRAEQDFGYGLYDPPSSEPARQIYIDVYDEVKKAKKLRKEENRIEQIKANRETQKEHIKQNSFPNFIWDWTKSTTIMAALGYVWVGIVAFTAQIIAFILSLIGINEMFLRIVLIAILQGAVWGLIGGTQQVILGNKFLVRSGWMIWSAVGGALGGITAEVLGSMLAPATRSAALYGLFSEGMQPRSFSIVDWIIICAVAGAIIGAFQWYVLRQNFRYAGWWVIICAFGSVLSLFWTIVLQKYLLTSLFGISEGADMLGLLDGAVGSIANFVGLAIRFIIALATWPLYAFITGYALWKLSRDLRPAEEI